jgi:hypothetical protein
MYHLLLLLEWLYSPCGPSSLFSFLIYSIHNRQDSLNEWSAHRKASTETSDGKWPIILLRGPLGVWGSLTCSQFTTQVKQLRVPPGGLVPWIFPSLKIRRPPPGLNPRHSSPEVRTLPLDYGGRSDIPQLSVFTNKISCKDKEHHFYPLEHGKVCESGVRGWAEPPSSLLLTVQFTAIFH